MAPGGASEGEGERAQQLPISSPVVRERTSACTARASTHHATALGRAARCSRVRAAWPGASTFTARRGTLARWPTTRAGATAGSSTWPVRALIERGSNSAAWLQTSWANCGEAPLWRGWHVACDVVMRVCVRHMGAQARRWARSTTACATARWAAGHLRRTTSRWARFFPNPLSSRRRASPCRGPLRSEAGLWPAPTPGQTEALS